MERHVHLRGFTADCSLAASTVTTTVRAAAVSRAAAITVPALAPRVDASRRLSRYCFQMCDRFEPVGDRLVGRDCSWICVADPFGM